MTATTMIDSPTMKIADLLPPAAARVEAKKQYAESLAKTARADAKKEKGDLVDWSASSPAAKKAAAAAVLRQSGTYVQSRPG